MSLPATSLARLRVGADRARAALERADVWDAPDAEAVVDALARAADPAAALGVIDRLAVGAPEVWQQVRADRERLDRLTVVAGVSDALGDLVVTHTELVDDLVDGLAPRDADAVADTIAGALADLDEDPSRRPQQAAEVMATNQRRGLLRIAARDLLGLADTPQATAELADLAAGCVAAALAFVRERGGLEAPVSVIGMGKLGGHELNYVSDIDLVVVADGDLDDATQQVTRAVAVLSTMTPLGAAYDVDLNLRPEGRDGPLVRTLDGFRSYYDRWAATWEQQALLKARPIAGDRQLGAAFSELVIPYVWPDRRDPDTVAELQHMKGVVESSSKVRRAGDREVKLGPGGLRDIEFAVQLLQLVHGRHDERLRSRTTLDALAALAAGGYVDEGDAALFSDAYQFLRTVEHRLQLRRLRRTHVVPQDDGQRYRLARACGFRDLRAIDALGQFDRENRRVRAAVRRLHEQLFYRPLLDRFAEVSGEETRAVGGTGGFDEQAAIDRLAALGFRAPKRSMTHLRAMATGSSRTSRLLRTALPTMLPTLAEGPDPDAGLLALRTMAERLEHAPAFVRTLRDHPPVGQILARVLSRSRLVGEWLERQPEVFSTLADPARLDEALDAEAYRAVALGLVRRGEDHSRIADSLRRFKRREVVRTAVRDLTGRADVQAVAAELTGLADACLEAAVRTVSGDDGPRLAVIALGRHGAGELGYASDLDCMVVFDPPDARTSALKAVEEMLRLLSSITPEGQAFVVDLRLRPEGADGPLARTLESTARYYREHAQPWERFAMTQAAVVAGDHDLGEHLLAELRPSVWPDSPRPDDVRAIRAMKARLERERPGAGRRSQGVVDVKLGPGGIVDIEWTLQLLAVQHVGEHEELARPGALPLLTAAAEAGVLPGEEAVWLRHAWRLLAAVRNAQYLAGARNPDRVALDGSSLEHLAAMLGYERPGAEHIREDLLRVTRRARRVHERRFYG